MNLAGLQRMSSLISLSTKISGELTDEDLLNVSHALAGNASEHLLPILKILRDKEPGQAASEILSSPTAHKLFAKMQESKDEQESIVFVKCPHCAQLFETEIN